MNKVNLGCGLNYKEGWINVDSDNTLKKVDVVWNLNNIPYPFKSNSIDRIYIAHVLEHLDEVYEVLKEMHRICKKGAIIEIYVPYFNNYNAFRDLSHKQFFTWDSFSPVALGRTKTDKKGRGIISYQKRLFNYKSRRLKWASTNKPILKQIAKFIEWCVNINPNWLERRIPFWITCESMRIELEVLK